MKITRRKEKQILGLFATLNKIERDIAISNSDISKYYLREYVRFDCEFKFLDFGTYCDVSSQKMVTSDCLTPTDKPVSGYFLPSAQILWDDECKYEDFRYVVEFARNAIKSGGIRNMTYASHKVTIEMPDYLGFELRANND